MEFLKRLAFYVGLVLGLATVAAVGSVFLTYLFTGRFPAIKSDKEGTKVTLMAPDEVTALVRGQLAKGRGSVASIELS
jgi:hypothetical protein